MRMKAFVIKSTIFHYQQFKVQIKVLVFTKDIGHFFIQTQLKILSQVEIVFTQQDEEFYFPYLLRLTFTLMI
jgi:hypothetical protein